MRDVREAQLRSKVLYELTYNRAAGAVDTIAMRIREIKAAKASGPSWDKAAVLTLLSSGFPNTSSLPNNALALWGMRLLGIKFAFI